MIGKESGQVELGAWGIEHKPGVLDRIDDELDWRRFGKTLRKVFKDSKEQLQLFADRTSAHRWWPNQFRLLLSSLAYVLLETIRRLGLKGTELAQAQVATIRLKLLKIGALIVRNTRRVRFLLSSAYPYQPLFWLVAARLKPG